MDPTPGGEGTKAGLPGEQIARLLTIARQRRALDVAEREIIMRARQEGWTFAEIGRALGVSRQAVHAKLRRHQPCYLGIAAVFHADDVLDVLVALVT